MAGTRKRKAVHDDDPTPNTETKKPASKRKRQGVTKTNSAAVKALIRQNQLDSPLLRLAPEIREKILTYLVGGQVLHLYHSDEYHFHLDTNSKRESKESDKDPARINYLICQANTLEAADYQREHIHEDKYWEESSGHYFVQSPEYQHIFCKHASAVKEKRQGLQFSLNILGVSRQCYEEANHILWSTNTFTFDNPRAFDLFFSSLNAAQKRNLRSLSFFADVDTWSFRHLGQSHWQRAFQPANLSMLQRLQSLSFSFDLPDYMSQSVDHGSIKSQIIKNMDAFLRFRMIPLKKVSVSISGDPEVANYAGHLGETRLTTAQKAEIAREWERTLLDADPAATIDTEEDAQELIAYETFRLSCERTLSFFEHGLDHLNANAEAAALLVGSKAQIATVSPSMKAVTEYNIKELERKAANARNRLDNELSFIEEQKALLPGRMEIEAIRRQKEREARKRQWEACKPRVAARTKPVAS